MTYTVVVLRRADIDINQIAIWWADNRDVDQAIRWLEGIREELKRLARDPECHQLAPESEQFGFPVRQMLYGIGTKPTHRIVYRIRDDRVLVHAVRHLHQDQLTAEDLTE